jgi:branched-chain amino acid transport system substrate-binding protein
LNYIAMYVFAEAIKAAGSVDDPEKIMAHMQDGLDNLPEDKKVYVIPKIDPNGGFEAELIVAAIEDGKVVPIKAD